MKYFAKIQTELTPNSKRIRKYFVIAQNVCSGSATRKAIL